MKPNSGPSEPISNFQRRTPLEIHI